MKAGGRSDRQAASAGQSRTVQGSVSLVTNRSWIQIPPTVCEQDTHIHCLLQVQSKKYPDYLTGLIVALPLSNVPWCRYGTLALSPAKESSDALSEK